MATLRYKDEHNKVGYLQKPTGSDDYHQILDFLRASHIRSPAILATIDETPYTITEDSVRSQLQLADDGGIDDLPIAGIYSVMDNLWYVTEGKSLKAIPTGKPKVPAPVPTGRQNRPFPVPTDRGYSPSVTSGWWKSTARPMPHLNRPTSSYF
ncbi:hypothetical protein Tco_0337482 [Tanacetum coccineum]